MNDILFDKIQSVIGIQHHLEFHFHFHHGTIDIEFEKPHSTNDEFSDLLSEWFHEELKAKYEKACAGHRNIDGSPYDTLGNH